MDSFIRSVLLEKGSHVFVVDHSATVHCAVRSMNEKQIGALLVLDDQRQPAGMFTERDILVRVVDSGRDPDATRTL